MHNIAQTAIERQSTTAPIPSDLSPDDAPTPRDYAITATKAGLSVFPLAPNRKVPAFDGWQKIAATSDMHTTSDRWTCPVTEWVQPFNIGIATGGLLVVDVHNKGGKNGDKSLLMLELRNGDLPPTYEVETPTTGRHLYYRLPPGISVRNSVSRIALDIDIRGDGGFVVGEGSCIGGKAYRRVAGDPAAIAEAPAWLVAAAGEAPQSGIEKAGKAPPLVTLDNPQAEARAIEYLKKAAPAVEGDSGDNHTIVVANRVLDEGLSIDLAADLMDEHWNDRCAPPWDPAELRQKVLNASKSRQRPVGVASPEAEFGPEEVVDRRTAIKTTKPKLYYLLQTDVKLESNSVALIDGWYDRGAMVVTYGESGSGKTNVVLSQAFAIAAGKPWAGAPTERGLVVYVAAEGGRGIRKRVMAWRQKIGDTKRFALVPCGVDLLRPSGDTQALIELVHNVETFVGEPAVMVVIDTLARAISGGNENAPDDMGALVMHCDRIREATGATVHLIHHSGKNVAAGARGHSSLKAATDTEIEIADGTITATKQRDMDYGRSLTFTYEPMVVDVDNRGRQITTVVAAVVLASEFEPKQTREEQDMYRALKRAIMLESGVVDTKNPVFSDDAECDNAEISPAMAAAKVTTRQWKEAWSLRHKKEVSATTFRRGYAALVADDSAIKCGGAKHREFLWKLAPRRTAPNAAAAH